ncbi:MAG: hypothetical protein AAF617_11410, partial [Bacteroidota bacterium]
MKPPTNPIKSLKVDVYTTKGAKTSKKLCIEIWARVPANTFAFKEFSPEDLFNLTLEKNTSDSKLGI